MTTFDQVTLSDVRWPRVSQIINATSAPGFGPMRVRSFKRRASEALQTAGYSPEEIAEGWKRHWTALTERLSVTTS